MLTVYLHPVQRPSNTIDMSTIALDQLADTVNNITQHQRDIQIWFGYLDGWMMTPKEEVILRKAIRKFECYLVTAFPLALPQSWKNEIRTIYTDRPDGDSDSNNNGGAIHYGGSIGYGGVGS